MDIIGPRGKKESKRHAKFYRFSVAGLSVWMCSKSISIPYEQIAHKLFGDVIYRDTYIWEIGKLFFYQSEVEIWANKMTKNNSILYKFIRYPEIQCEYLINAGIQQWDHPGIQV